MFRRQIRPSSGALWDCICSFWYNAPTLLPVPPVSSSVGALYQNRTYSQKVLLRMGEFVAETCRAELKKINRRKDCCILLVIYISGRCLWWVSLRASEKWGHLTKQWSIGLICFLFTRKKIEFLEITEVQVCFIQDTKYKINNHTNNIQHFSLLDKAHNGLRNGRSWYR